MQTESDDTKAQMLQQSLEIKRLRTEVARLTKAGPGEPESGRTSSSRKGGASSSKTRAEIPSQAADLNLNLKEILVRVLQGEEAGTMPGGAAAPTTTVRVSEDNAKKLHTVRHLPGPLNLSLHGSTFVRRPISSVLELCSDATCGVFLAEPLDDGAFLRPWCKSVCDANR